MAITQENIDYAIKLGKEFGVTKILLFGSALEDPRNANDLDLAIDGINPSDFFLYAAKLEDHLFKNVDLVPLESDSPFIEHIKKYGKFIYDEREIN